MGRTLSMLPEEAASGTDDNRGGGNGHETEVDIALLSVRDFFFVYPSPSGPGGLFLCLLWASLSPVRIAEPPILTWGTCTVALHDSNVNVVGVQACTLKIRLKVRR